MSPTTILTTSLGAEDTTPHLLGEPPKK
eukprot:Gb_08365 [translate_table: standard]